jgi:hypothetical protein
VTGDTNWLTGTPMDPAAVKLDPLPPVPGFPFVYPGASAVIAPRAPLDDPPTRHPAKAKAAAKDPTA